MGNGCLGKEAGEDPEEDVRGQDFSSTVTFIDVLFAVVMGLGLTQVMGEDWFDPLSFRSVINSGFDIAVISVGYLTLFCSWWGYHRSVSRRRKPYTGTIGVFIFVVDIILLAFYWLLLVKFESFVFVLSVLVIVFAFYVFWDTLWWLKGWNERQEEALATRQRRAVTIFWTEFLTAILGMCLIVDYVWALPTVLEWFFVLLANLALLSYRIHKEHLFFRRFLDILVFKFR